VSCRELALRVWRRTRAAFSRLGADGAGTTVHQDRDAVFTSYAWLRALLLDARTLDEVQAVVEQQMRYYNRERRHSGLAHQPSLAYLHAEGFAA
jgi:transposase InsO family protein